MLFTSLGFALFLPLLFAFYWPLQRYPLRWQNLLLLGASYYFYASWDPRFLLLILISSATDYLIGLQLEREQQPQIRKRWLGLSLGLNLGLLGFFKYFNFFVGSFVSLGQSLGFDMHYQIWAIILPVGISFYTFQTLSYTIDIYRGQMQASRDPVAFFTFVAFFPQLVAGPIERAKDLLPQFLQKRQFRYQEARQGLEYLLWGLFKKIVIADQMVAYIDPIYGDIGQYTGLTLWLAALGFGIVAYCDFSGYSDMAIGIARLFGFRLSINFAAPFFSTSIREFWGRWHITLMTWFRDYIYYPAGGSRVTRGKWMRNILLVFGISGLWHGAAFTYIAFGLAHGMMYLTEWGLNQLIPGKSKLPKWVNGISTFFWVTLAWIFFRAESMQDVGYIFSHLTEQLGVQVSSGNAFREAASAGFFTVRQTVYLLSSLAFFVVLEGSMKRGDPTTLFQRLSPVLRWGLYYGLVVWGLWFGAYEGVKAFLYFQF